MHSRDHSTHVTDERINTVTSIIGSILAIFGASVLLSMAAGRQSWLIYSGLIVYCAGLINLFIMSSLHHGLRASDRAQHVFRTLDYTAIFWLIAGTVTPLILIAYPTRVGYAILVASWVIAAVGIALRASLPTLDKHINNTFFITLGWLPALVVVSDPTRVLLPELVLLILGGAIYSLGFWIYVSEKPNLRPGTFGFHELWHCHVVVAASLHWLLIYRLSTHY